MIDGAGYAWCSRLLYMMDEGSRRTSEARLAAEALLSHSITRSSSLNAINYGFVFYA